MNEETSQLPDLRFNFHDAMLVNFQLGPRRELTLHVALYSIYYPHHPLVQVRFSAITNFESVQKYFENIDAPSEADEPCARIDALHYDTKKASTANKLFFCLELDWYHEIQIHCAKLDVILTEKTW